MLLYANATLVCNCNDKDKDKDKDKEYYRVVQYKTPTEFVNFAYLIEVGATSTNRGCAIGWTGNNDHDRKRNALGATGHREGESQYCRRWHEASGNKV